MLSQLATLPPPATAAPPAAPVRRRSLLGQYAQLAKLRLTGLVLVTTAVGFILASRGTVAWGRLAWTILGTGLLAAGASAFNQLLEVSRDARMARTRHRPLPSGQMSPRHAWIFALLTTSAGLEILNAGVNPLTSLLGLANLVMYLAIYTPLKPRTSLNTLVGAVCGAVPPLMGWSGAAGELTLGAVLLGAILFVWQIPHFLALAWLYRADYARAGYRMLPVIDPTGRLTCLLIVLYSLTLLPLGLAVMFCGVAGYLYGAASLVLGLAFFGIGLNLRARKSAPAARRVFLASVLYLPLLLGIMVADARTDTRWPASPPAVVTAQGR